MNMNFLFSLSICISLDKCNCVMNIHIYVCKAMDAVTNMQNMHKYAEKIRQQIFHLVNFPVKYSNIPAVHTYRLYIFYLI